ncbi:MAG: MarR family transcriptional regulator [Burkholderiaceae bacterium]
MSVRNAAKRKDATPAPGTGIDRGRLPQLLGYRLRLAQLAVFADFAHGCAELGVTPGVYGVLELLARNPGLSQSALAQALRLDRSSLVPVIDRLEDLGWARRTEVPGDRRRYRLDLTAAGRKVLAAATTRVLRHEQRIAALLTEREAKQLAALLARIAEALPAATVPARREPKSG